VQILNDPGVACNPKFDNSATLASLQAHIRQVSNPSVACKSKFDRTAFPLAMYVDWGLPWGLTPTCSRGMYVAVTGIVVGH